MFGDFIGLRFKRIREDIFGLSQTLMSDEINDFIKKKYGKKQVETSGFNQNVISLLELNSKIRRDKFMILIQFLYTEKRINPSWFTLEQNESQPLYLTRLVIDSNLIEKQKEIREHAEKINQTINDIDIVIQNSAFN